LRDLPCSANEQIVSVVFVEINTLLNNGETMKQQYLTGFFCFIVLLSGSGNASPEDTLAGLREEKALLQKEIAKIEAQRLRTDSLKNEEQQRYEQQRKRIEAGIAKRRADIEDLNEKSKELSQEIQMLSGRIRQTEAQQKAIESQRTYLRQKLAELTTELENQIRQSLPWDREKRLDRVIALKKDLVSNTATVEDAFSRLSSLVAAQRDFGDNIELQERTVVRNDGSSIQAQVLRLGDLWMVYVDNAGENYGICYRTNDNTFAWIEDLDFAEREHIRMAIRVKDAKRAPQLVDIPLILAIEEAKGGTNE